MVIGRNGEVVLLFVQVRICKGMLTFSQNQSFTFLVSFCVVCLFRSSGQPILFPLFFFLQSKGRNGDE